MMSENLIEKSCADFVTVLASAAPTPGGGGAAALVGAIGVALGNMVGSLTVGKKKYADVENEILDLKEKSDALQEKLLTMVEKDAQAFAPLARAYGLPVETEEQRAEKAHVMEQVLHEAALVPLQIMELCMEALDVIGRFAQIGSKLAVSDAGCAAACVRAALSSAALNVLINTKSMKNRVNAEELNARAGFMLYKGIAQADAVFESVRAQLN
ncbi:MAG: cyclodeaminase/cyclohydrolase family protein [Oscillospiraceae bacterium]